MTKPRWKLYLGDGTTYSDLDGPPELAPGLNVQCVVQFEGAGRTRTIQRGGLPDPTRDRPNCDIAYKGYYCYSLDGEGLWTLTDGVGLIDYLQMPGWKTVKFGRSIEHDKFNAIVRRAVADPDFL
jgi:hypothetical protein